MAISKISFKQRKRNFGSKLSGISPLGEVKKNPGGLMPVSTSNGLVISIETT
jgi:hypothetical protein